MLSSRARRDHSLSSHLAEEAVGPGGATRPRESAPASMDTCALSSEGVGRAFGDVPPEGVEVLASRRAPASAAALRPRARRSARRQARARSARSESVHSRAWARSEDRPSPHTTGARPRHAPARPIRSAAVRRRPRRRPRPSGTGLAGSSTAAGTTRNGSPGPGPRSPRTRRRPSGPG